MVMISLQIVVLEKLLNANQDIFSNHMPIIFVEKGTKAIWTRNFGGA
jgi:hypothetical protein